jgi:hypothetical protein
MCDQRSGGGHTFFRKRDPRRNSIPELDDPRGGACEEAALLDAGGPLNAGIGIGPVAERHNLGRKASRRVEACVNYLGSLRGATATKQSSLGLAARLDCFASLAMTSMGRALSIIASSASDQAGRCHSRAHEVRTRRLEVLTCAIAHRRSMRARHRDRTSRGPGDTGMQPQMDYFAGARNDRASRARRLTSRAPCRRCP